MIINYFLLALSMTSMVTNDSFRNLISKRHTKNSADLYKCNVIVYLVCFVIYFCLAFINGISLFTVYSGIVFGH